MNNAVIKIKSTQGLEFAKSDEIEFITDGEYQHDESGTLIRYMESELTGLTGTETAVSVRGKEIIVRRRGTLNSRMEFREGEKSRFLYDTQFGSATLSVDTRKIRTRSDPTGCDIQIDYVVDMDHAVVSRNSLNLNVKRVGN